MRGRSSIVRDAREKFRKGGARVADFGSNLVHDGEGGELITPPRTRGYAGTKDPGVA